MDMKEIVALKKLKACNEAIEYVKDFSTPQEAWDNCERGDWMLWLVGKKAGKPWSVKRRKLVGTTCKCARLAWRWIPKESRQVIVLFEQWAVGKKIDRKGLRTAASAAVDVAAAAVAVDVAAAVADVASAAANAVDVAAADVDACAANTFLNTLKKYADIVRKNYQKVPKL